MTQEEASTLDHLCAARSYAEITVRGTKFTTQKEAKRRAHDNSGAMFMAHDPETGEQVTRYGTILQILVCSVPGQEDQPFAEMLWHEVIDETNCGGRLPLLKPGKLTDEENLKFSGVPLTQVYAQNVAFLPEFQHTNTGRTVALYRLSDYNPLHDFVKRV